MHRNHLQITVNVIRSEMKTKCDMDVLSWFQISPSQSQDIQGMLSVIMVNSIVVLIFSFFHATANIEDCVLRMFRKKPDFLDNLNAQVKKKESLSILGSQRSSLAGGSGSGGSGSRGRGRLMWSLIIFSVITIIIGVSVYFYRRWMYQKKIELLLQGQFEDFENMWVSKY